MKTKEQIIRSEYIDSKGIEYVTIAKIDFNFLYDMSDLLMSIQNDIQNIRGILEDKAKIAWLKQIQRKKRKCKC